MNIKSPANTTEIEKAAYNEPYITSSFLLCAIEYKLEASKTMRNVTQITNIEKIITYNDFNYFKV